MVKYQRGLFVVDFVENKKNIKILTDSGWSEFSGVVDKGSKKTLLVALDNGKNLITTPDHIFYTEAMIPVQACDLRPTHNIIVNDGTSVVLSIQENEKCDVFDIIDVKNNNRFFANDILISNCEFIINDETLISPGKLIDLEGKDPILKQGQVRWYKKPVRGSMYLVALDPSLGTGGDNAAIQVFELPSLEQVAEWQHNRTPINQQIRILREINRFIVDEIEDGTSLYYSVENNTIGEAALLTIEDIGEENIPGMFLSEPKRAGSARRFRKGFNTTSRVKISSCAKLKNFVERNTMKINSKTLISELKNFVAHGSSYAAKPGETDDLVMATILAIRIADELKNYDPEIQNRLSDSIDDLVEPMPFIASF